MATMYKLLEIINREIPQFIKNIWRFKNELWEYRDFDEAFSLSMFRRSLESLKERIRYGFESDSSRNLKLQKIERAIKLLKWHEHDTAFICMAEQELGYSLGEIKKESHNNLSLPITDHHRKVFRLAEQYELDTWEELFRILEGNFREPEKFDGSCMKTWWD